MCVCVVHTLSEWIGALLFTFLTVSTHDLQLIQCKADPNTVNEHGNTPLHYACFWGQDEVAEVRSYTHTEIETMFFLLSPLVVQSSGYNAFD